MPDERNGRPPRSGPGASPKGFNPDRLADMTRPVSIVPQIVDAPRESRARGFTEVKIVGVGGGGSNAVNRMIETGVQGVEFIAVNSDAQALQMSQALRKVGLGGRGAKGLGAGGDPTQGERAAEVSADAIAEALAGADMVFLTSGMGGGTGTGAAPVVAEIARRERALTVGIVTLPFAFEGRKRRKVAEEGIEKLRGSVDALIVIPNDRLTQLADRQMSVVEAFRMADDVLRHGVQGISDLVTQTGLINLDFADVKSIMQNAGTALMAIGEGKGEGRAVTAARAAIGSPLLDVSIEGARGVLLNITGGPDMTLAEVTEAAEIISQAVDPEANIMLGTVILPRVQDEIKITVIATGLRDAPRLEGREEARGLGAASRFGTSSPPRSRPSETETWRDRPSQSAASEDRERTREPERERRWDREPASEPRRSEPAPQPETERRREPERDRPRWRLPLGGDRDRPRQGSTRDDDDFDVPSFLRRPRR